MFIYSVVKTQIPAPPPGGAVFFCISREIRIGNRNNPVDCFCRQFKNWRLPQFCGAKCKRISGGSPNPENTTFSRVFVISCKNQDALPFCSFYERQGVRFWCPENNYLDSWIIRLSLKFLNASLRRKPQKIKPFGTIIPIFIPSKSTWISPPRSPHWQKRI